MEISYHIWYGDHTGTVTEIMSDHSIYLRVSGVYIHEITQGLTPYLCVTRKVPAWSQV
jgi:hypothetical protein